MGIKATVLTTSKNRVSISSPQRSEVRSVGITSVTTLRSLNDVDAMNMANNNTIVYDSASDKFVVKELPVLNGGTF